MEAESMQYIVQGMKYLSIAIISLVMLGAAKGVASIWTTVIASVSRNPEVKKDITVFAWGGAALTEAIALYAFGLALILGFVL